MRNHHSGSGCVQRSMQRAQKTGIGLDERGGWYSSCSFTDMEVVMRNEILQCLTQDIDLHKGRICEVDNWCSCAVCAYASEWTCTGADVLNWFSASCFSRSRMIFSVRFKRSLDLDSTGSQGLNDVLIYRLSTHLFTVRLTRNIVFTFARAELDRLKPDSSASFGDCILNGIAFLNVSPIARMIRIGSWEWKF